MLTLCYTEWSAKNVDKIKTCRPILIHFILFSRLFNQSFAFDLPSNTFEAFLKSLFLWFSNYASIIICVSKERSNHIFKIILLILNAYFYSKSWKFSKTATLSQYKIQRTKIWKCLFVRFTPHLRKVNY